MVAQTKHSETHQAVQDLHAKKTTETLSMHAVILWREWIYSDMEKLCMYRARAQIHLTLEGICLRLNGHFLHKTIVMFAMMITPAIWQMLHPHYKHTHPNVQTW
mmetsp:Transcript_17488/g.30115  ORF Transcript_17488/g.30115 Transcript_17488/m.30115 type:complete len:104 (+) Transcript_17488:66-377(+)